MLMNPIEALEKVEIIKEELFRKNNLKKQTFEERLESMKAVPKVNPFKIVLESDLIDKDKLMEEEERKKAAAGDLNAAATPG
jgi:hypothetical protein